jgi:hypothetical protein
VRAGGGHQSRSLRLVDSNDKEYVMRAVKKKCGPIYKALRLKTNLLKTILEIHMQKISYMIFYTTAHPYAPLGVGILLIK